MHLSVCLVFSLMELAETLHNNYLKDEISYS